MLFSERELTEQLAREKHLFQEILALSERQLLLFGQVGLRDDKLVEACTALIDERKTLMDLVDAVQAEYRETAAVPGDKELVNKHRQELEAIITNIQRNDQQVMQMAKNTLADFANKLQEVRYNKKAVKAYYGEADTGGKGWFIDRKK